MEQDNEKYIVDWFCKMSCQQFAKEKERAKIGNYGGVYLWVAEGKERKIWYVGETNNFEGRFRDHFTNHLGGKYHTFSLDKFNRTMEYDEVYKPGEQFWDKFSARNECKEWMENALEMLYSSSFLFAKIKNKKNEEVLGGDELRKRVEGFLFEKVYGFYKGYASIEECNILIGRKSRLPKEIAKNLEFKLSSGLDKTDFPEFLWTFFEKPLRN